MGQKASFRRMAMRHKCSYMDMISKCIDKKYVNLSKSQIYIELFAIL